MDLRKFDLNLLLVLDALLRERSVSLAARRLVLTQSTVSAALGRLRQAFNDELFIKSAKGVEPTQLARELEEPVAEVLATVRQRILLLNAFDPATTTRQFVLIAGELGQMLFAHRLLPRIRAEAPDARLRLIFPDAQESLASLESGRADLAIGFFPQFSSANLVQQKLYERPLYCVARADHPALQGELTTALFAELDHLVVAALSNINDAVEAALRQQNIVRRVPVELGHSAGVQAILQASDMVAVVPDVLAGIYCASGVLRSWPVPCPLPMVEVRQFWHKTMHKDPAVAWLRGIIKDTCDGFVAQTVIVPAHADR